VKLQPPTSFSNVRTRLHNRLEARIAEFDTAHNWVALRLSSGSSCLPSARRREISQPNDVAAQRDGAIYFSNPSCGRKPHFGVPRPLQLDFRGVYRLAPG
jgi:hypothetical protein